jgi:hypothetical protein
LPKAPARGGKTITEETSMAIHRQTNRVRVAALEQARRMEQHLLSAAMLTLVLIVVLTTLAS